MLNGESVPLVWHRSGLQAGDPLSHIWFVLVRNSHMLFFRVRDLGLLCRLTPFHLMTVTLYADEVVVFCRLDREELSTVRSLLALFRHARGRTPTLPSDWCPPSVAPRRRPWNYLRDTSRMDYLSISIPLYSVRITLNIVCWMNLIQWLRTGKSE